MIIFVVINRLVKDFHKKSLVANMIYFSKWGILYCNAVSWSVYPWLWCRCWGRVGFWLWGWGGLWGWGRLWFPCRWLWVWWGSVVDDPTFSRRVSSRHTTWLALEEKKPSYYLQTECTFQLTGSKMEGEETPQAKKKITTNQTWMSNVIGTILKLTTVAYCRWT